MKKIQTFLCCLLVVVCCSAAEGAAAPATKPSAEKWLVEKGQNLMDALTILNAKKRYLKLRRLAFDVFNQKEMSRLAMGKYWKEMTPEQQETLQSLFFDYFVVTYGSFNFDFSKVSFKVTETVPSGKDLLLKTQVHIELKEEDLDDNEERPFTLKKEDGQSSDENSGLLEILFALRETPTGYYIRDAKFEGQSIMMFLRSHLEKEYKNASFEMDDFLEILRNKINKRYRAAEDLDKMQKKPDGLETLGSIL